MEQEIDLRPYIQAVLRQWLLLVGVMLVFAMTAAFLTLSRPSVAKARGDVLVVGRTAQVTFDDRFVERDATMFTGPTSQRQALIDLASSPELEARVAEQLGLASYETGSLLARVTVTSRSDLLLVEASAPTPDEAKRLAETWARSYEALVNEIYATDSPAGLDSQIDEARQRYDQAQAALSTFYAAGDLVRAQQSVIRAQGILTGSLQAQVGLYTGYLSRTQELNLILEDARTLQAQYEDGGADLGANLAALVVRARLAGAETLPIQLSLGSAEAVAASQADLAEFIRVLTTQRDRMVSQSEGLASEIAAGSSPAVGLSPDARARYEADLAAAQSALSQAESQEKRLLLERETALGAIEVLQARKNDLSIGQAAPEVSVRFIGAAIQPPASVRTQLLVNVAVAVVAGLMLTIALIVVRELLRRLAAPGEDARANSERAGKRPVATD